jgi:hypothetical protein
MSGIYMWTSPSGKVYIGLANNLEKRKKMFLRDPFKSKYTSPNSKIDNARRKYPDFTQWQYEVLEYCDKEDLERLEMEYIAKYNSTNKEIGYNLTIGGNGVKGQFGEKNPMYGRHHTQEMKDFISKLNKGRKQTKEQKLKKSKPVIQYSKNGRLLKKWDSATEAANFYGVDKSCIGRVCMGKKKSTCDSIWKYYDKETYLIGIMNNNFKYAA